MRTRENRWLLVVMVLALMTMLYLGSGNVQAAPPEGVLKEAIHWGSSADWLDPATSGTYMALSRFISSTMPC